MEEVEVGPANQQLGCACIVVTIESARQLLISDLRGSSDPFAKCTIIDEEEEHEKHRAKLKARTPTVKKNLNPQWLRSEKGAELQDIPWYHVFVLDNKAELGGYSLLVEVWDEDNLTKNDLLGSLKLPLSGFNDSEGMDLPNQALEVPPKFRLKHITYAGEITLSFKVFYFSLSNMRQLEGGMKLAFDKENFWAQIGCADEQQYVRMLRSDMVRGISDDPMMLVCRRYAYGSNHPPAPSDLSTKERDHWRQVYRKLYGYYIKCVRNGNVFYIASQDILVGDILFLSRGTFVDIDCLVLRADNEFQVSEMRLTGEQKPKSKVEADVVSAGTVVTHGTALVMATAVGIRTVFGAELSKTAPTAEDLGVVVNDIVFNGSLGVSTYKQWVQRVTETKKGYWLVSEGYLTKHRKSVIASWLFGTIYRFDIPVLFSSFLNKHFRNLVSDGSHMLSYQDAVDAPQWGAERPNIFNLSESLRQLVISGITLNTKGVLEETPVGLRVDGSDSKTDAAFLHFLRFVFRVEGNQRDSEHILQDFEYADGVKSCIATNAQGQQVSYVLGFASHMKDKITHWIDKNGVLQPIGATLDDVVDEFFAKNMAQVVLGYKIVNSLDRREAESGLTMAGVFGIKYPTLTTSQQAIRILRVSGIHVVLVTSRPLSMAMAVARESGIFLDKHGAEEAVMTGDRFMAMTAEEQASNAQRMSVMGNASSGAKEALVKRLKLKFPVCFQGKSIGSIPAMKLADLSVAMHTADDSACAAANAAVLDDDIVKAALLVSCHKLWADIG